MTCWAELLVSVKLWCCGALIIACRLLVDSAFSINGIITWWTTLCNQAEYHGTRLKSRFSRRPCRPIRGFLAALLQSGNLNISLYTWRNGHSYGMLIVQFAQSCHGLKDQLPVWARSLQPGTGGRFGSRYTYSILRSSRLAPKLAPSFKGIFDPRDNKYPFHLSATLLKLGPLGIIILDCTQGFTVAPILNVDYSIFTSGYSWTHEHTHFNQTSP